MPFILEDLLKKNSDATISLIKSKNTSITGLPTTAALYAVKNEMPNVSNLVKKNIIILKY